MFKEIVEAVERIAPLPLFVLATGAGVCLFASEATLSWLGLRDFRDAQRMWIGVAFLGSTLYLVGHGIGWSFRRMTGLAASRRSSIELSKRMGKLTWEERLVLREFYESQSRSLKFDSDNPGAASLLSTQMLWRPAQQSMAQFRAGGNSVGFAFIYHVADEVWDYIMENPSLLYSQAQWEQMEAKRLADLENE